ncbi:hypothetical protein P153DRAFT_429316 [Dothidotthia symphoricarpi CBS 119687]|uniref:F-box domain-containing protein n=1 Tax=Dothidotthia symphoricarpi CBS 119687 TaxID=1392245 RepID=A0A6A6ALS7_9PLEO|nr:uncharacterized protein P153DRAFT_429316 [Dothidotthia symphoricarpi CBS 119687]KAF2132123.1 hypothetical protein P153DRAFT_429316 [Dothidotthia symphoricarpi CBS 119687]
MDQLQQDNRHSRAMTLDVMPVEMISEITSHLKPRDLTKLARVSKKLRDFAQCALWRDIELHRQDAHQDCFGLDVQRQLPRTYLDDELRDPWSYRDSGGTDHVFEQRTAKFGTAIRKLYRTAGKSQGWSRLAPFIRHLCLTITYKSPPSVWNMVLSLSNLNAVELIGEFTAENKGPPAIATLHEPAANKIRHVRLRGYIPGGFVSAVCKASAASIVSLDLGILERPQIHVGDAEDTEYQQMLGYPLYIAPRGALWYTEQSFPTLTSLTHLLLCKRGRFDGPPEMSEEEDGEIREDEVHDVKELKQWASLLQSVSSTIVEVVLEQRPVYLEYLLHMDMDISPHDKTGVNPDLCTSDSALYQHVLGALFDNQGSWPKLQKLTFRGWDTTNLYEEVREAKEPWHVFMARVLPQAQVEHVCGNHMFFSTRKGTILNQHGADGLMPHLDFGRFDEGYLFDMNNFMF